MLDEYEHRCHGCGIISEYVYCAECASGMRCPHGEKIGECAACDHLADLAHDAAREQR